MGTGVKRQLNSRQMDRIFSKNFGMEDLSPSELRDEMKRLGYSPNTGLFKKMLKSRGKSNFKDGGEVMNTTRATQLNPITGEPI